MSQHLASVNQSVKRLSLYEGNIPPGIRALTHSTGAHVTLRYMEA
jgi:hypothetical protein